MFESADEEKKGELNEEVAYRAFTLLGARLDSVVSTKKCGCRAAGLATSPSLTCRPSTRPLHYPAPTQDDFDYLYLALQPTN